MPRRQNDLQRSIDEFLAEVSEPDADVILEGVMAACALIAYADGRVAPEEQARMLTVIPRFSTLRFFPQSDMIEAFETATGWFEIAPAEGRRRALSAIGRIRQHERYRLPLLRACHAIAVADQNFDAREREALVSICGALDLDPADFGLRYRV
jgi:tellurite resistance protein TerB